MATDVSGNLYVVQQNFRDVAVYAPDATKPFRTLADPDKQPWDVAVASDGTTYVSNIDAFEGSPNIAVYERGSTTISYVIADVAGHPAGLALDASGDLYTVWQSTGSPPAIVREYAPDAQTGTTLDISATDPSKVAFDPRGEHGRLGCDWLGD